MSLPPVTVHYSTPARRAKRLHFTAQIFAMLTHIAVLVSMWGSGTAFWLLIGLWLLGAAGNMFFPMVGIARYGYDRAENMRAVFNVAVHVPLCLLCSWNFASWLFVPLLTALATTPPARNVLPRILMQLAIFDVVASVTGARWQDILAFSGIALFLHFVLIAYLELLSNTLRERDVALRELHATQKQAIAQEKLASIGQIAAGIAHEINNPMCYVTANVDALLEDLRNTEGLPPALAEYRDEVLPETIDGIRRVNSIVDDLRRFARGEPERFIRFDLTTELTAAVRMARTQLKPGQTLELEAPPALEMKGSPRQLCQVVLNLLVNGVQALPEQGQVRVVARQQDEHVEIVVSDDGAGMSEEIKRHLFEPFFSTKARHGVGLGLAVVHGIVTSHGGTIDVESAPGSGSRFRMRLPLQCEPVPEAAVTA